MNTVQESHHDPGAGEPDTEDWRTKLQSYYHLLLGIVPDNDLSPYLAVLPEGVYPTYRPCSGGIWAAFLPRPAQGSLPALASPR